MATPEPLEEANRLTELADDPVFIFLIYALTLTPLALYVYHDVLDVRWRPVWRLVPFLIAYSVLYLLAGSGLLVYMYVQLRAKDYKEVGASALAFILGTYGAWKLMRLGRIILAHRFLVSILQRIDVALCKLTGLPSAGLHYHLFRRPKIPDSSAMVKRYNSLYESRHDYISSVLFDDDYPGEAAARVRWLAFFGGRVVVSQDDADECASRVALWMRLVLRRPSSQPWRLLTATSPLIQGLVHRPGLGEALRSLIAHGSARLPTSAVDANPAEVLLNNGSLTEAGVGFFWIASEMGSEEMAESLADMPPHWMRGVTQNGKQLMFELVMSLLLCDAPPPSEKGLAWLLSLPVLDSDTDISNMDVWSEIADVCADAVSSLIPSRALTDDVPTFEVANQVIRSGVLALRDATSEDFGFQGDIVGLTLLELIRAAYRAGMLAEKILGDELNTEFAVLIPAGADTVHLYKAEIVTGLFALLFQLGLHACDNYREHFDILRRQWGVSNDIDDVFLALCERARRDVEQSFNLNHVAASRYWYLGQLDTQCEDPYVAFSTVVSAAIELAPFVLIMIKQYQTTCPRINFADNIKDPQFFREQWYAWKRSQAIQVSGSADAIEPGRRGID